LPRNDGPGLFKPNHEASCLATVDVADQALEHLVLGEQVLLDYRRFVQDCVGVGVRIPDRPDYLGDSSDEVTMDTQP
jgi:hypothetical protein